MPSILQRTRSLLQRCCCPCRRLRNSVPSNSNFWTAKYCRTGWRTMKLIRHRIEQELLDGRCGAVRIKLMWRLGFLLTCLFALGTISEAQTATLTLLEDLSSKLPTGTEFTARDAAGRVYKGHVVTHPARRL